MEPTVNSNSLNIERVVEIFSSKMEEITKENEKHAAKMQKENSRFRKCLGEMLQKNFAIKKVDQVVCETVEDCEPLMFGEVNLMTVPVLAGPSVFGRAIAILIFGNEQNCLLINKRLGVKVARKDCRESVGKETEAVFIIKYSYSENKSDQSVFLATIFFSACVNRKFGNDPHALSEAVGGANQLGRELRKKYPQLVVNRQSLSTA